MNKFEHDILTLIRCALNDEQPDVSGLDYEKILAFSKSQQIVGLTFSSLAKLKEFQESGVYGTFLKRYLFNVSVSENQLRELDGLFQAFEEKKIDFVPLKGAVLKKLYPLPEMRTMGDADILIKTEQFPLFDEAMRKCGFEFIRESNHELIYQKNANIHVELHKRLIPSYNKDYYNYYGDGWNLVKNNQMSKEDTFIYLLTHFAKHYRDKGAGVKYVVDFYVYLRAYPEIDRTYIESELKKLQLFEFYANIMDLLEVWFGKKAETEKTDTITRFLFSGSVYGVAELSSVSDGLKMSKEGGSVKKRKFFRLLFPTYAGMKSMYKILQKIPVLLPFAYVYRWFEVLFTRPKNIKKNLGQLKYYNKDEIERYQAQLNYVGLDFNFEEKKEQKKYRKKEAKNSRSKRKEIEEKPNEKT